MKKNAVGLAVLAASGLCLTPLASAIAQSTKAFSEDAAQALNPVTVTATLAPRTADDSLASVTVIDEAELRRNDPVEFDDLLRARPGVDVSGNGDFGKVSSISIRGAGRESTLLMIDGIRLRSATAGSPAWSLLDPRLFQRVEVVRGPRSSLYGADAVGGVVQLFTAPGEGEPSRWFEAGTGSFDTQRYSTGLSGSQGGTRYNFAASRISTDGIELKPGGEDKGYDNTSALVRLSHTFDNDTEVGLLGLRARGNTEYVGGDTDFVQQVAGVYGELPLTDHWRSRLTLSEGRDDSDEYASYGDSSFDTRSRTLRWGNVLTLGHHELIAGAEYSKDEVDSSVDYNETSRTNKALFAQGLADFTPLTLQAGARYDDNEAFGDEVTGSLALGYDLSRHHALRASYGTAFRAPSFNELYYPGFSNPDLDPERSRTLELGIRGQFERAFWDLAVYRSHIDDLIANEFIAGRFAPYNVDEARIQGVELGAGLEVRGWDLKAALTYTAPEDQETGNRLARQATQSLRLDADRHLGDWTLGGSFVAQNHRYNDAANEQRLGGFGLLDLRAAWQFAPLWTAQLSVDNVFDRGYATAQASDFEGGWKYRNAGRGAFLSVRFGER